MKDIKDLKNICGIYILKNNINGKIYIGKSTNIMNRIYQHSRPDTYCKTENCSSISNAIKKYGFESFSIEILEIFDNETDPLLILQSEAEWIKKLNSTDRRVGYNILSYGTDWTGMSHSEETKRKIAELASERYKGENNPMFGKNHSFSSRDKISKTRKNNGIAKGSKNPFYNKKHSEETRRLMSEKAKSRKHWKEKRPIIQICKETGVIINRWKSIEESSKVLGFSYSCIFNACRGVYKQSHGFIWRFEDNLKKHNLCMSIKLM